MRTIRNLAAALLLIVTPGLPAQAAERIAAIDWAQAETLLALGLAPLAIAEPAGYRDWVGQPELPETVADIGSRRAPNLERLAALKPDLILSHDLLAAMRPRLEAIAPVRSVVFGGNGQDTWQTIVSATRDLGAQTGREAEAQALLARADTAFAAARRRIEAAGLAGSPVYVVRLVTGSALRIDGDRSMAAEVLVRLGLRNAYDGPVNEWGFATAEVDALAGDPDAFVLAVGPNAPGTMAAMFDSPVGRALPAVGAGRVRELPVVWTYGGVPSAMHMADAIADALAPDTP